MAGTAGFGPDRRLRQPGEFSAVFARHRVLHGEKFSLHYRPNDMDSARFGLVIAKRLARRSVWRNAIKRTGREAFRLARANLPRLDLVLRLAKPVLVVDAASRLAWRSEINALLARLPR